MNQNVKTMTSKKHGGFNENLIVEAIISQKKKKKKQKLVCVSLCHKDFKNHLLIKVLNNFSE